MPRSFRLLALPALLLACAPPGPGEPTPLVDGVHAPLILTEQVLLDKPPADSGNRFLAGWWPGARSHDPSQINVGDRVVLEAVFLDRRERRLVTRLDVERADPGATFGARVAGVELPPQPLTRDLEVPLPGGLPLGRQPIELDLRGAKVEVHAAGFGHAWPPGEVDATAETIVQGGYSAIDFPRRLAEPASLVGQFEPPAEAEPDQRFAAIVETDDSSTVGFEWRPGRWRDRLGPRRVQLKLPAGFVRVRLLAQGLGPAGRWQDMSILGEARDPAAEPVLTTFPARTGTARAAASRRYQLVWAPGLGLPDDVDRSRDAEYLFNLRRDPEKSRNLAGARSIEVDWLRSRLGGRVEAGEPR